MATLKRLSGDLIVVSGQTSDGVRIRERYSRLRHGPKFEDTAQARYEELLFENSGLISQEIGRKAKNMKTMTVSELATQYVDQHLKNTKAFNNRNYIELITAKWGNFRLNQITIGVVRPWVYSLLRLPYNGHQYSPYSVKKIVRYFQRIFAWGCEVEIIDQHPLRQLIDMQLKKWFKRTTRSRKVSIPAEEFFEVTGKFPARVRRAAQLSWYTGMREGEICNLLWDDVDGDIIELEPDDDKEVESKIIALEPAAQDILAEIQAEQMVAGYQGDYVFPDQSGMAVKVFRMSGSFAWHWSRHSEREFRFHDIRHCYKQRKRREGFDARVVRAQMGHRSVETSEGYDNVNVEELRAMANSGKFQKRTCSNGHEGNGASR